MKGWDAEVARLSGLVLAGLALVKYVNDLWANLFARIDALVVQASGGAVDFSPMSLANYVLPLDVMLTLLAAYALLKVECAVIRIIKAFVPSIA